MVHRLWKLSLLAAFVATQAFSQGNETTATKDDWEEINFEVGSATLSDGYPSLLRLADLLRRNPTYRVRLVGHGDYRTSARAEEKLTPRIRRFAAAMGVAYERIMISDMRVRWASCTPKSNLNFNWRIVKAPDFVIDYLIVHELAHLLESNHTAQFWNTVAVQVPRYALAKAWLRENGAALEEDLG